MITTIIHNSQSSVNSEFTIIRTKFSSARHNYDYRCREWQNSKLHLHPFCHIFSHASKPTHALLASKRCPISLQKMPF